MINFYAFSLKRVLCIIILLIFSWVCIGLWSSDKNRRLGVAWRYTNIIVCIVSFFLILKMTILGRKVGERELVQKFLNKWTIFLFCSILFSSNQKEH